MFDNWQKNKTLSELIRWAEGQPTVRVMMLTSTRAVPGAQPDNFSDYDVILALTDVRPFATSRDWLSAFGRVLVMYQDPLEEIDGFLQSGNVTQFEEGLKIDFSLWPVEYMRKIAAEPELPAELDAGYQILLDKDQVTAGIQQPTYRAYIPTPPTEATYIEYIECFLQEAQYVAKYLWRGDLMAARYIFVQFMTDEHLRPMLEWHMETEHGWSVKPGLHGRRLQNWLRPDLWEDLKSTWVGAGEEENWEAIYRAITLMRKAAVDVGERLGFAYPDDMEQRSLAYLHTIQATPRSAACTG